MAIRKLPENLPPLALLLIRYRQMRNMTQVEVAEAANLRPATVSDTERGQYHPNATTINGLKIALDIPDDEVETALRPIPEAPDPSDQVQEGLASQITEQLGAVIASQLQLDTEWLIAQTIERLKSRGNLAPEAARAAELVRAAYEARDFDAVETHLTTATRLHEERLVDIDRDRTAHVDAMTDLLVLSAEMHKRRRHYDESIEVYGRALVLIGDSGAERYLAVSEDRARAINLAAHISKRYPVAKDLILRARIPHFTPDVYSINILIHLSPDYATAKQHYDELAGLKLAPDIITRSTLIAQAPDYATAKQHYDELAGLGLKPGIITVSTLIAKAPDYATAKQHYDELAGLGLKPDEYSYNSLIDKAPNYPAARQWYNELRSAGLVPNKHVIATLVRQSTSFGDAFTLVRDMRRAGQKPDARVFGALMVKTRDLKIASDIFRRMKSHGIKPNAFIYQQLILCARSAEAAMPYLREMLNIGYEPDRRTWQILARYGIYAEDLDDPGS